MGDVKRGHARYCARGRAGLLLLGETDSPGAAAPPSPGTKPLENSLRRSGLARFSPGSSI